MYSMELGRAGHDLEIICTFQMYCGLSLSHNCLFLHLCFLSLYFYDSIMFLSGVNNLMLF